MTRAYRWGVAAALLFVVAGPWLATALADDVQVNTYTTNGQSAPSLGVDGEGHFVVIWGSDGSSGTDRSGNSIQGQRFASDGSEIGGEFQINTYTTFGQYNGVMSMASSGGFVVVWEGDRSSGDFFYGILGQRFASDGSVLGTEFQVNTYHRYIQRVPAVSLNEVGEFVVVWESYEFYDYYDPIWRVQGQRFASDGSLVGEEFQVNTYTTGVQTSPAVSLHADGSFVVVWRSAGSAGTDLDDTSIQGQRYASSGKPVASEFQVNTYTRRLQVAPDVAMDLEGDFVVVWESEGSPGDDNSAYSIQGQRYASDGAPVGDQFQVNTYVGRSQRAPSVSMNGPGQFVVAWQSDRLAGTDSSSWSIQGQRFAADGSMVGGEIKVNTYTTSHQWRPTVALARNGELIVAWGSDGSAGSDSSSFSIQRTPKTRIFADGFETGDTSAWSNGL